MTFGAKKYDDWNWARGFDWSRILDSLHRHIGAWQSGEDLDQETGISHLAHASCNIMFLQYFELFDIGKDDRRYKQLNEK